MVDELVGEIVGFEIAALVRNGIKASLMTTAEKDKALADVDRVLAATM